MKVNILARPDHSVALYKGLSKLKDINPNLYTFYATRQGSILNKILPKRKSVPPSANTFDLYTLLTYSIRKIIQPMGLNFRELEIALLKPFLLKSNIRDCEIMHYWPFYCIDFIKKIKKESNIITIAEYYEAEPSYVNKIYEEEYSKFNIVDKNNVNTLIDQNESFMLEDNFIVGSSFTKKTYENLFPDKNIFVCSYGSAGNKLIDNIDAKVVEMQKLNQKKLIYVGQISVEKGVHYLINAISKLNVTLDLIGPIRRGQEEVFNTLVNKNSKITLHGPKKNSEIINILKNYSLFILPSLADNYSLAVSEALSQGLPVIVTDNCGNSDDILKYNLGYSVEAQSSVEISKAIEKFFDEFNYENFTIGLKSFFDKDQYPQDVMNVYKYLIKDQGN